MNSGAIDQRASLCACACFFAQPALADDYRGRIQKLPAIKQDMKGVELYYQAEFASRDVQKNMRTLSELREHYQLTK